MCVFFLFVYIFDMFLGFVISCLVLVLGVLMLLCLWAFLNVAAWLSESLVLERFGRSTSKTSRTWRRSRT